MPMCRGRRKENGGAGYGGGLTGHHRKMGRMGEKSRGSGGDSVRAVGHKHGRKRVREWRRIGRRRRPASLQPSRPEVEGRPDRWARAPPVGERRAQPS
ncbi:hypothetical protein E2562_038849 [Oryza meyeriana var. granulata]|uniref:Uncharacterized protein n=1 Tax=Oryza meyeriana var. granulata TaxID=110450 RepID=A0A6G1FGR6_9ORYZ|nr:hypothetical protein E2562_038849 [Oryza meyeriana var. granulata]